jgi:hypothetical protein
MTGAGSSKAATSVPDVAIDAEAVRGVGTQQVFKRTARTAWQQAAARAGQALLFGVDEGAIP